MTVLYIFYILAYSTQQGCINSKCITYANTTCML